MTMDFTLSEEQAMLAETIQRFLADHDDGRRPGARDEFWRGLADLGILGLPFAEADGGFGRGAADVALVMERFGRALVTDPYLEIVVLAGALLRNAFGLVGRKALIAALIAGERVVVLAHAEPAARGRTEHIEARAVRRDANYVLSGRKAPVVAGGFADDLVVSARFDGGGIGLFLVRPDATGLSIKRQVAVDGRDVADIKLNEVVVSTESRLDDGENGLTLLRHALEEAMAAQANEVVGLMSEALDLTVEYLKTRRQFGAAIGSFQALQHRAADMFVAIEQARSMALIALKALNVEDPTRRASLLSAARVQILRAARFVGQNAVQLHGGIGVTRECKLGRIFTRLSTIDREFGDANLHLDAIAGAGSLLELV